MERGTDTLTLPKVGFPPPVAGTSAGWPGQISQAPSLPTVTPAIPRPAISEPVVSTFSESWEAPQPTPPRRRRPRRGVTWLILLALIGGLAFAGVRFGPDLIDNVRGVDQANGPAAALEFPAIGATGPAVRTATFTISDPDVFGGAEEYEVTTDFESGVARVVLPREATPDLEILSVWDQAFIRRIDEPVWYSMPRGDFPIDHSLGRTRWVRTIDELVPLSIRGFTSIAEANESSVGTEPARRLVVDVEVAALLQGQTEATTPPADAAAAPPAPPVDGVAPAPDLGVAPAPTTLPPGLAVSPAVAGVEWLQFEVWVDDTGLVRKSVMPAELGGETITVTSVSPDPWEPRFPTPDEVQPLTAQALLHLGL